jgi:hypothetical protein
MPILAEIGIDPGVPEILEVHDHHQSLVSTLHPRGPTRVALGGLRAPGDSVGLSLQSRSACSSRARIDRARAQA